MQQVEALGYCEVPGFEQGEPAFYIEIKRRRYSRGADASFLEILMQVSIDTLEDVAAVGLTALAVKLAERLKQSGQEGRPLDEQEAIEMATGMAPRALGIPEELLKLRSTSISDAAGTVVLRSPDAPSVPSIS